MKYISLFFFLCLSLSVFSQTKLGGRAGGQEQGPPGQNEKDTIKPPITDYKIISFKNDTTFVDTTLTITKDYTFNYLRKDNFELLAFPNTGQTYNSLSFIKDYHSFFPEFGARARHFNFMEVEDINYYHVPTPFTDLYFKTVPEQGQQLDALFTINTSQNFNAFIAYKGTRALGRFQHILTSTGNLRMGFSYDSDDDRYHAKGHFVSQDLLNEENGGLTDQSIQQYIDKEEEFDDRSILEVNFEDAKSTLFGKRFYLNHSYRLAGQKDSLNSFSLGHVFDYSYKKFQFKQNASKTDIFGPSFESSNLNDETRLKHLMNELSLNLQNNVLGSISLAAGMTNYEYGYNSIYINGEDEIVTNKLAGNIPHVGGNYKKNIGGFDVTGEARINISSELPGNYFDASAGYRLNEFNKIRFGFNQNSSAPNFNFLLYQSDYINYNWQNDFSNESSQRLYAKLDLSKIAQVNADLIQTQNYTFFAENANGDVKPFQSGDPLRYFKVRAEREFNWGIFGMYHTLMYQNVLEGSDVLNVPDFVTRNSVYYQDFWFKEALYLQTGFTLKYFTKYQMNAYDPVLAEFYIQDAQEFSNFPVVDFFFNAKVDTARLFFKLQHLNALFNGNNNFSAPGYPYGDFLLRFGIVWDFFM
ncbi:putative porin [Gramella sp. AN32]|uniref:Porin n=1 Tax=Christiangramia antarctica TaxID=2058158 RepID=A0ABW5X3E0_9FLAO|nr:putative porin [Gramella sp. AN32]MCM4156597.1 hypothetical protein [Gramella sp. AN32]